MTLVSFDDDFDWEFAFDSRLGHPTGSSQEPMAKRSKKRCEELPILHPDAVGIDVGASELFVAVSAVRDPQPVRSFPTFTRDLNALADWLQQCGIRSVATPKTILVNSFAASLGSSVNPKLSPPRLTNSLGLCITCSALKRLTTKPSFTAATKKP
jgi:hypothetical protein